ncbi:MAG TPA: cyclic 2,3-diphosphoglycerate synthase [Candidatus Thermoplasmatota archaeon]|nr:cyclic 2,3-diphosphoglycerate synthase [Candidatus Thermoplasmatota archaeon]
MAESSGKRRKVIIMGAAGRDFHNFNVAFRGKAEYEVVAFTATQIPSIGGRLYPPSLAGALYPKGIAIHDEKELDGLIAKHKADLVVFAYSDTSHEHVMHKASQVLAAGADFALLGPRSTALASKKPVISVCAVRTGCGKSQTTRAVVKILRDGGKKVVAIRHPMPYGDLAAQAVQRFANFEDLDKGDCTIEEREEYEPHIEMGAVVYAGVDYEAILRRAEREADVIVWDGGNNDLPFYESALHIVIADALRPGHELAYHPGEANVRDADVVIINKIDQASPGAVDEIRRNVLSVNSDALLLTSTSPAKVQGGAKQLEGKRVIVVEDGPTTTHGGMGFGAGYVAVEEIHGVEIVDPRPHAVGSIRALFERYPHLKNVVPAMGYTKEQVKELEDTINQSGADIVVAGTPIDLKRVIKVKMPVVRVRYDCPPELVERLRPLVARVFA